MPDETRTIALPDERLDAIFGRFDENLKFIESSARVRLSSKGHDLLAEGDASAWNRESYHPRWARLFNEQPEIKAVVAGHLHRDELHWIGSVPIYVASSLARFWDRQPSFRLYEYRDGKLGYWTIYLKRTPSKKNQP